MYYFKKLKTLHYKKLFIYGAFSTIIILALISTTIDTFRGSADAYYDFLYAIFTFISFKFILKDNNVERAGILLFWISAIFEYIFIYINNADFDLIFSILIPIIAFISMSLRQIIINLILYYLLLIVILTYFYFNYPSHFILHNIKYLLAFIYAHIFMVAYGFFYYLSIDESIKRLENLNKQNNLLLTEVHHRVKNNLNIISSILGLQAFKITDTQAKNAIESSRKRIESMATLHEVLYKNRAKESINLKNYIEKLAQNIISSESTNNRVELLLEIEDRQMSISSLIQFGIMLNEMLTNSIKYAVGKDEKVNISIKFQKLDEYYNLIYCDNAKAVNIEKLQSGFGYNLINLAIAHFNGELTLHTPKGLCYDIILKEI